MQSGEVARQVLEVDGLSVGYRDVGAGPPLLLVHGLGVPLETWARAMPGLAAERRVVALDLPGFGLSDRPEGGAFPTWHAVSDFLSAFVERLGLVGPLDVAGHSMGGLIAAQFALEHGRRVSKLVLVDAAGLGREIPALARLGTVRPIGEALVRPLRPLTRLVALMVTVQRDFADSAFLDRMAGYIKRPGGQASLLAYLRMVANVGGQARVFSREELGRLTMPTLVIWGAEDRAFPLRHARAALDAIPNCRAVALERTGHAPSLERPDTFNRVVLEFLARGRLRGEGGGLIRL